MAGVIRRSGAPTHLTGSGAISLCPGTLLGFYVCSTTSGTIVLKDGGSGGTAVTGTITPSAGWNECPIEFATSAYATLANTIDVTFIFAAG